MKNRQWLINGNPRGRAIELNDFLFNEEELQPLEGGQVRVKVELLSFDPSQKGQMENVTGYASGNEVGNVMVGRGIGEVIESNAPGITVGAKVMGGFGWQEYATLTAREVTILPNDDLLSAHLGALGSTGLTAYFGLLRIGKPEAGDTVVVSGAAGGVGSIAGQIAKLSGTRVIGIAGSAQKCAWLTDDLGFDAAINYKSQRVKAELKHLAPNGVDVYFDNVGGPALDDVLTRIATHARIVVCGGIARYEEAKPTGPVNYFNIVFRQATMQGFLLTGYESEYGLARERLAGWIRSGEIRCEEDVQHGFEQIPGTLLRLFSGANLGKQLLQLG